MDIEAQGAEVAESPAADVQQADPTPAAAQNTAPQAQPNAQPQQQEPFHTHPRWQQLMRERAQERAAMAEMAKRLDEYQKQAQQRQQPQSPMSDEERQIQEAVPALAKILKANPDAVLEALGLKDKLQMFERAQQGVQRLTQAQQQQAVRQGMSQIADLTKASGLPTDDKSVRFVSELVVSNIKTDPELQQMWQSGDTSGAIRKAFEDVQSSFISALRRDANAAVAATKAKTAKLPPAPTRGGIAGQPAPEKPQAGKEREYLDGLGKKAMALLENFKG